MEKNDCLYTKEHEWVLTQDEGVFIGITDYAQQQLGDLVYVELPKPGTAVSKGDLLVVLESSKVASEIYSPVSGTVSEVNTALEEAPEKIKEDPLGTYMVKMTLNDRTELEQLLSSGAYENFLKQGGQAG